MNAKERDQERFYTTIAEHYSDIFPFNAAQLSFLVSESGSVEEKNFLDAGCGTGELAFALAGKGAIVLAIDLNDALLGHARKKRSHENISFLKADMLDINELSENSAFDGVICFGNTLVHLSGNAEIAEFFKSVNRILKPEGRLFLQILHYDYVFRERIDTLPLIENEFIRFERYYKFQSESRYVRFNTRLTIWKTGERIENETELYGIGVNDLTNLLQKAGFTDITLYGDFQKKPFGNDHLPLVAACRKRK